MAIGRKRNREEPAPPLPTRASANPTLSQLAAQADPMSDDDRAAHYSDWAQRMRDKRSRAKLLAEGSLDEQKGAGIHWTTEQLFEESRRVDEEELHSKPNPWQVQELLAVLDLREGATSDEIGDAYRRLAKRHHPDRFAEADELTRDFHASKMREIIDAYTALKTLEKSSS